MGDHKLSKRVVSGEIENADKGRPGGKKKQWTDCMAEDHRCLASRGTGAPPH